MRCDNLPTAAILKFCVALFKLPISQRFLISRYYGMYLLTSISSAGELFSHITCSKGIKTDKKHFITIRHSFFKLSMMI